MTTTPVKQSFSFATQVANAGIIIAGKSICERLHSNGFEAYFVGGSVRDLLINPNTVPKDIDIATSASPENIRALFPSSIYAGKSFGVAIVKYQQWSFEVATFRRDGTYSDRRHPDSISPGTLYEDSCRRDFTINALFLDPLNSSITDFHEGMKHIQRRLIACVGQAEARLHEDPLRILRLCRFAARFHLDIEEKTLLAAQQEAEGVALLSRERILTEVLKVEKDKFHKFCHNLSTVLKPAQIDPSFTLPAAEKLPAITVNFHQLFPLTAISFWIGKNDPAGLAIWPAGRQDQRLVTLVQSLPKIADHLIEKIDGNTISVEILSLNQTIKLFAATFLLRMLQGISLTPIDLRALLFQSTLRAPPRSAVVINSLAEDLSENPHSFLESIPGWRQAIHKEVEARQESARFHGAWLHLLETLSLWPAKGAESWLQYTQIAPVVHLYLSIAHVIKPRLGANYRAR